MEGEEGSQKGRREGEEEMAEEEVGGYEKEEKVLREGGAEIL